MSAHALRFPPSTCKVTVSLFGGNPYSHFGVVRVREKLLPREDQGSYMYLDYLLLFTTLWLVVGGEWWQPLLLILTVYMYVFDFTDLCAIWSTRNGWQMHQKVLRGSKKH